MPGRASDPSRSRDGDDGGYRLFRGFLIGYLGSSSRGQLIGERRGQGGDGVGQTTSWRGPGLAARLGGVAAPSPSPSRILASDDFRKNRHFGFCPFQFQEYSFSDFLGTKNNRKQAASTVALVNRLVQEII